MERRGTKEVRAGEVVADHGRHGVFVLEEGGTPDKAEVRCSHHVGGGVLCYLLQEPQECDHDAVVGFRQLLLHQLS